jgi:hypothetical protein
VHGCAVERYVEKSCVFSGAKPFTLVTASFDQIQEHLSVIVALFTQSLNGYAANSLSRFERARFDKLFNAEGEQHREFCDISAPSIFSRMSVSF